MFEPFIAIFLLNYFIWDLLIGPILSCLLLKCKSVKMFYKDMIESADPYDAGAHGNKAQ